MVDRDIDLDGIADAHGLRHGALALMGDRKRGDIVLARLGLGHLYFDGLRAADNAEAGRGGHFEPAVELVLLAGEKRVHGRIEAERRRLLRNVVDLAVRDHDDAGQAVGRNVGQGFAEIGE